MWCFPYCKWSKLDGGKGWEHAWLRCHHFLKCMNPMNLTKTMQHIKMRFLPLRLWGPAHSNGISIIGLMCSLGCRHCEKLWKFTVLSLSEWPTQQFSDYGDKYQACSSRVMLLPDGAKSRREMLQRRNRKCQNTWFTANCQTAALNHIQCKWELTLQLHFWVVRFSGLSLHFHCITDYLHEWFLRMRVSDYWWCPSMDHLLHYRHFLSQNTSWKCVHIEWMVSLSNRRLAQSFLFLSKQRMIITKTASC